MADTLPRLAGTRVREFAYWLCGQRGERDGVRAAVCAMLPDVSMTKWALRCISTSKRESQDGWRRAKPREFTQNWSPRGH